jgi:uncharacterized protein (TIGR02145 family)
MKLRQGILTITILLIGLGIGITSCGAEKSTDPEPPPAVPVLTTTAVSDITRSSSESGGNITSDKGYNVIDRGVCWSTTANPTVNDNRTSEGTGMGVFTSSLTGLVRNTTYYVRAFAINSQGTGYGDTVSFTTLDSAYTVTDIDGNVYQALSIGTQVWMTENLKVMHYRNGEEVPYVSDNNAWIGLSTGAYCNYNNFFANAATYGSLYNWYAVNDDRNLAPEGWHIPSQAEWQTLLDYLGGESTAGGKMKEVGTAYWMPPNTGATNECGFSALPGGFRVHENGSFQRMGNSAGFWSTTGYGSAAKSYWMIYDGEAAIIYDEYQVRGLSIRCIKD